MVSGTWTTKFIRDDIYALLKYHENEYNRHLFYPLQTGHIMHALFLVAFLLLSGCSRAVITSPPPKLVDASEVSWVIEKIAGTKWAHERGRRLRLEHSSICYYDSQPTPTLRLELSSQEILEVKEARYLLVDFVENLLRELNTNPIVGSGLVYPLGAENLRIEIDFGSFFGLYVDPFFIGYIDLKEGYARYYAFDQKDRERSNWHARVEPYWKTREVAMMERAAEAEFVAERHCEDENEIHMEGYFDINHKREECLYQRKF